MLKIQRIKFSDIKWTAVARFKCMLCGSWKRKKSCPPYSKSVMYYKDLLKKFSKIYIVICETDGSIPWRFGLDKSKLVKKENRGLKGAAKGMALALHKNMLELRRSKGFYILISGSCSLCRPCNVDGKCLKKGFAHSPEGIGIDVIGTVRALGYTIEDVPFHKLVNVAIVCKR